VNAQPQPDIEAAFERACFDAVTSPNLTLRQQLWVAFNAGGQYAIQSIGAKHGVDVKAAASEASK
jgi:hypothetical protein